MKKMAIGGLRQDEALTQDKFATRFRPGVLLVLVLILGLSFSWAGPTCAKWQSISPQDGSHVTCLAIDLLNPRIVYAGTQNGVFKSTDGGGNWIDLTSSFEKKSIAFVVVDPINTQTIYVGT